MHVATLLSYKDDKKVLWKSSLKTHAEDDISAGSDAMHFNRNSVLYEAHKARRATMQSSSWS